MLLSIGPVALYKMIPRSIPTAQLAAIIAAFYTTKAQFASIATCTQLGYTYFIHSRTQVNVQGVLIIF